MRKYTGPTVKTERLRMIAPAHLWQMDSGDCIDKMAEQIVAGLGKLRRNAIRSDCVWCNYLFWRSMNQEVKRWTMKSKK
jgi:hypothetical protein